MSRMIAVMLISMFVLPGLLAQPTELLIAEKGNLQKYISQELAVPVPSVVVMVNSVNAKRISIEVIQNVRFETEKWMKNTDTWGNAVFSVGNDIISEDEMKVEEWMKSTVSFENPLNSEASLKVEDWMLCSAAW